jgi:hypothetical protein
MKYKMSATTLLEFSSELRKRNIARQNLFFVTINLPTGLVGKVDQKLASMWCHAAQTPHTFLATNDNFVVNGTRRKYAYDVDFQNLVLNFYIDQKFEIKRLFDAWKQLIVPYNRQFNFPADYTAESLKLSLLNQEAKEVYTYTFKNVYPKTINNLELSFSAAAVLDLNVEFVFEDVFYTSNTYDGSLNTSVPETLITETPVVKNTEISQSIIYPTR